jgi:hypothetical protein
MQALDFWAEGGFVVAFGGIVWSGELGGHGRGRFDGVLVGSKVCLPQSVREDQSLTNVPSVNFPSYDAAIRLAETGRRGFCCVLHETKRRRKRCEHWWRMCTAVRTTEQQNNRTTEQQNNRTKKLFHLCSSYSGMRLVDTFLELLETEYRYNMLCASW